MRRNSRVGRAREVDLARGERPVLERRVDDDVVVAVGERVELTSTHAEAPLLLPVRRPVRDQRRVVRVREDVLAELVEADDGIDRGAVTEHVQRRVGRVDDARAVGPLDPGAAEVPLARDRSSRRPACRKASRRPRAGSRVRAPRASRERRRRSGFAGSGTARASARGAPRRARRGSGTVFQSIGIAARLTIVGRIARLSIGSRPTTV